MLKSGHNIQLDEHAGLAGDVRGNHTGAHTVNNTKQSNANAALDTYFLQLTDGYDSKSVSTLDDKKRLAQQLLAQANNNTLLDKVNPEELAPNSQKINNCQNASPVLDTANESLVNASDSQITAHNDKEIEHDADIVNIESTRDHNLSLQASLPERFQVLLCKVAGLTIAVPLVELGGIHQLTKLSTIAGKPDWFKGILIKGDVKYQCIDAARWIMPEKVSAEMAKTIDYKFAIQLGKSPYTLCCESVSSTIELSKDEVKWRNDDSKRPWLAGLLKEKMCALIDGARMVQLVLHEIK